MQRLIAIAGRTLQLSNLSVPGMDISKIKVTTVETPALSSRARTQPILIDRIVVSCSYPDPPGPPGPYSASLTFAGSGSGSILASTARVKCQGKSILTQNDSATITITGTTTDTGSGTTVSGVAATVNVTLVDPGETNVFANKT